MKDPQFDYFGRIIPTAERRARSPIWLIGLTLMIGAIVYMVIS